MAAAIPRAYLEINAARSIPFVYLGGAPAMKKSSPLRESCARAVMEKTIDLHLSSWARFFRFGPEGFAASAAWMFFHRFTAFISRTELTYASALAEVKRQLPCFPDRRAALLAAAEEIALPHLMSFPRETWVKIETPVVVALRPVEQIAVKSFLTDVFVIAKHLLWNHRGFLSLWALACGVTGFLLTGDHEKAFFSFSLGTLALGGALTLIQYYRFRSLAEAFGEGHQGKGCPNPSRKL